MNILDSPDMRGQNSVVLFNLGVHYIISLNFTTYRDLVDSVIILLRRKVDVQHNNKPIVIWKTTTSVEREKARKDLTHFRFYTRQVTASSPVARDHWGTFELIIKESPSLLARALRSLPSSLSRASRVLASSPIPT